MKKIILVITNVLISISNLFDNPVISPQAFISELKFEKGNKWLLEIVFNLARHIAKANTIVFALEQQPGFPE